MNNMGFFNPFGGSGSGGGGGGSTANYSVQAVTDSSGQVSYKLTKNGTAVGDVISFNGSNILVNYGGELVVLNSAIAGIEEALDKTYNFTTFTELEIDTHNKTLTQITDELLTKNLPKNTIVTGQIYTDALPFSGNGEAEVLVNRPAFWWTCKSLTTAPYSWTALTADQSWGGVIYDWTPSNYELPIASSSTLGGVKVGENVQIASDGTISVITTKGDTGIGIASITKTSSSGLNDIYTITYTDSTTSTFTVTNGATITSGSIGQTGHLILTMSDGRTVDAGVLPTDNEVEVTTTSSQPADPNVELWVDLSTQQTLSIPEISDSSISSTQDTWSCKKIYDEQQRQETEIGAVVNRGAKNLFDINATPVKYHTTSTLTGGVLSGTSNGDWASYNVPVNLPVGSYIFSAVISNFSRDSGAGEGTIRIRITDSISGGTTIGTTNITGNGTISIPFTWSGGQFYIQYSFNFSSTGSYVNSFTASNSMIRPASIADDTYVPYAPTNRELYDGNLTTTVNDLLSYLDTTLIDTANASFEIRRYGKMCFARISLKTITSALTGIDTITISAIPAALRPEKSVYFPVVARNQAGWASATLVQTAISIDTSGNVMLRTCTEKANAAYVVGYFSYYAGAAPVLARSAEPEEIKEPETGEAGEEGKEER